MNCSTKSPTGPRRNERPGVKFNDADLIGNPIRLSISNRTLENREVELRLRTSSESEMVPMDQVVGRVQAILGELFARLDPKART